jgi:hypothetical protein
MFNLCNCLSLPRWLKLPSKVFSFGLWNTFLLWSDWQLWDYSSLRVQVIYNYEEYPLPWEWWPNLVKGAATQQEMKLDCKWVHAMARFTLLFRRVSPPLFKSPSANCAPGKRSAMIHRYVSQYSTWESFDLSLANVDYFLYMLRVAYWKTRHSIVLSIADTRHMLSLHSFPAIHIPEPRGDETVIFCTHALFNALQEYRVQDIFLPLVLG